MISGKPFDEMCLTMTSLKMSLLLFLAAFLFLSVVPTVAEVVNSISDCDQFLLEETPPQVPGILEGGRILNQNRYKPICQTFQNERRFVTLYDTENKIPVFSAYMYKGGVGKRPSKYWMIEPQLEDEDDKNMKSGDKNKTTYNHQAGDSDYRHNGVFDRGHLFPSSHAFNKSDKMSTFTLTNIVPQAGKFNQGSWNRMEMCIRCVMDRYCSDNNGIIEGYVVTGARPSANILLRNRINIPSMLWSAFCCYSSSMKTWLASAHWGDNVPPKNKHLRTKTLEELHQQLTVAGDEFKVFPGTQCPRHTTVTEFYPEIKNCNCPPSASPTSEPHTSTSGPPHTSTSGAPHTPTSGLLKSTSGPLKSTSGPPHTPTSGPQKSTSGPLKSTSGPTHTPKSGLLESTSGPPHTPTSGLLKSTSGPTHTPTSGLLKSISGPPQTPTSGPQKSTSGPPHTPTSGPLKSTSGPTHTPKSGLLESTSGPPHTPTSGLLKSTSGPTHTPTSGLLKSISGPPQTPTSGPQKSTSGPPHTPTSGLLKSISGPPQTPTSGPLKSTSGPPHTPKSGLLESTSGPPHTPTSGPLKSTSGPPHTSSSGPLKSTSGPPHTSSSGPPHTSSSGPPHTSSSGPPHTSTSGSQTLRSVHS